MHKIYSLPNFNEMKKERKRSLKNRIQSAMKNNNTSKRNYIHEYKQNINNEVYESSLEIPYYGEESLFCDTKFLEKIIGKPVKKTKECK